MANVNGTIVALEVILVSMLNVVVVYLAAFTYRLNWVSILTVMVFASIITAGASHYLLWKWMAQLKEQPVKIVVGEGAAVLIVALLSSLAVLFVLVRRFNLPMALGISLLSGLLSSALRRVM